MLRIFSGWAGVASQRFLRLAVFCVPLLGITILCLSSASSQQVSPDQLLKLQQQFGNDQGQNQNQSPSSNGPQSPVILQPAVPSENQGALAQSRLEEIMSTRAGASLRQFGYDQLGRAAQVSVPQTGAVDDEYVLGPGDEITVSLRGQENSELRSTVNRNGQIVLPRLAPVGAAGRNFGSVREDIDAAVHRAYVATDASIAVGRMRQISVLVTGEVNNPGLRLATGLSSAVDALLLSGGIRKTGSLRNVHIQRGGHEYVVDLYSILTSNGSSHIMRLADGDRIIVPHLGRTAAITGLVRQPGIYELSPNQSSISAKALLALAGGLEVRGRFRLGVLRITPAGTSQMTTLAGESSAIGDSEVLFVQLGADQVTSQATLAGATGLAGTYPVLTGTHLSDVLKAPGALGASPYTPFGLIVHKDPVSLLPVLQSFTPVAVLTGREDQTLQPGDIVRVFSANEAQLLTFVTQAYVRALAVQQAVIRNPLGQNTTVTVAGSVAGQSGQVLEISDISSVPANVQRTQITALLNTPLPGSVTAQRLADNDENFQATQQATRSAQSASQLQAAQRPADSSQANTAGMSAFSTEPGSVGIGSGNALRTGAAGAGIGPARNFTDEAPDADRFASNREVTNVGQLARQIGVDPLVLINFLVDCRVYLDGALRGPGYYLAGPSVTLNDLVQAAGGTVNWADESGVELISTVADRQNGRASTRQTVVPLRSDTLATYIVRPHDQFRFRQVFTDVGVGSINIQGEVRFPGNYPVLRGEHLSNALARAGGLTNTAYPYGTVYLRQSAAQAEHESYLRSANEIENQLIAAMTRVGNDKIEPATFAGMQAFVSDLRNQRAVGRISVTADPSLLASNSALDPLLETGDVIYIPQRPSTIAVLGQVLQPGNYLYRRGDSIRSYVDKAGGYSATADSSETFVVLPDGSARKLERSWLSFGAENLPPGSSIVVPRDITPLDLRQTIIDVSQIFSQFAISIASIAVLSKQ